jgi:putative phosphoribosyl transferase
MSEEPSGRLFRDRFDAGGLLAKELTAYAGRPDVLTLALPRGGVPVAYEVATALGAPLDIILVRKLGVPGEEELAMGAIAPGGVRVLNEDVVGMINIPDAVIDAVTAREQRELNRRERLYRGDRPPPAIEDKTVILIDDGIATGATMRAAIALVRQQRPAAVVVATPVAPIATCEELRAHVDDLVCVKTPKDFLAIGFWYEAFPQTTDDEIRELLDLAWRDHAAAEQPAPGAQP